MSEDIEGRVARAAGRSVTRVKVWTGLGTVLLTGAALSLLPDPSQAGAGKPASLRPARRRCSSSPLARAAKVAKVAKVAKAARVARRPIRAPTTSRG